MLHLWLQLWKNFILGDCMKWTFGGEEWKFSGGVVYWGESSFSGGGGAIKFSDTGGKLPSFPLYSFSRENPHLYLVAFISLTHFSPVLHFYTPWKRQKTFGLSFILHIELYFVYIIHIIHVELIVSLSSILHIEQC